MPDTSRLAFGRVINELRPHALWHVIAWAGALLVGSVISPALFALWQKAKHASLDWYFLAFLFATSLIAFIILVGVLFLVATRSAARLSESLPVKATLEPSECVHDAKISPGPTQARHQVDGSAPDVQFWHTVAEREAHGRDVRALVNRTERRVIITGISLNYLVWHCARELRDALSRGRLVGIVLASATPESINFYARYSRVVAKTLPTTHAMYEDFSKSLDKKQLECFALHHTDLPMTHSIGLYDDALYVNEFCIDCPSSRCPSFSPPLGSHSHSLFMSELKEILKESRRVYGTGHERLLGGL
jgi:hypothetical protein